MAVAAWELSSPPPSPQLSALPSLTPSPNSSRPGSPAPSTAAHASLSDIATPPSNCAANSEPLCADGGSVAPQPAGHKKRDKRRKKEHRKRKRAAESALLKEVRLQVRSKYVHSSTPQPVPYDIADAPAASGAYIAVRPPPIHSRTYSLDELVGPKSKHQLRLVEWDGRTPTPLVDEDDRVFAVLAGQPDDPSWKDVHASAVEALDEARHNVNWRKQGPNQRGRFQVLNCGVSFGGGQKHPMNTAHDNSTKAILAVLLAHIAIIRIAHFASAVFATWAPRLHKRYSDCLTALLAYDGSLTRNFAASVWASVALNFGPQTVTYRHRDSQNIPYGWCAITALGYFNHLLGGHLVLWDLKLVIQFPPGSTILIPSAVVEHSNTTIARHETRYSITQFSAGGLFRWVDQGFQLQDDFLTSLSEEERDAYMQRHSQHWAEGLGYFSTLDEINT